MLTDEEGQSHPMQVTVKDVDLVLASDTPKGHMTIRLQRRGDALTGSWLRDLQGGDITGTVTH